MIDVTALDARFEPLSFCEAAGLEIDRRRSRAGVVWAKHHGEATASLKIDRVAGGTGRFHCFPCHQTWDLLGFVAHLRSLDPQRDFLRVAEEAAALVGAELEHDESPRERVRAPSPPPAPPRRSLDLDALAGVLLPLDSEHAKEAAIYLRARALLPQAIADGWRYLDRDEALYVLHEREGMGGDPLADAIGVAGLVGRGAEGCYVAHPENRLVIPWLGPNGEVDTLQRRRLDGKKTGKYVFITARGPLFLYGIERLQMAARDAELVLVEGATDVLARRTLEGDSGRVVLGLPGTGGWKPEWSALAHDRVVRLALDADAAGDAAANKIAADLFEAGARNVLRSTPTGAAKDWADLGAVTNQ